MSKLKLVVAVGGASGSLYAKLLLDTLSVNQDQLERVGVVMSKNAKLNWNLELGKPFDPADYTFDFYESNDFMAPFASGSAKYHAMVVIPCSMGLLARIATGVSNDLPTRAADVILKERRKLILVPRETPYNLIHVQNMEKVIQAGGMILPASPSLYSNPASVEEFCMTVIHRVVDKLGIEQKSYRWGEVES